MTSPVFSTKYGLCIKVMCPDIFSPKNIARTLSFKSYTFKKIHEKGNADKISLIHNQTDCILRINFPDRIIQDNQASNFVDIRV